MNCYLKYTVLAAILFRGKASWEWKQDSINVNNVAVEEMFIASSMMSSDGSVAAIGATLNDGDDSVNSQHFHMYRNDNNTWVLAREGSIKGFISP